MDPAISYTYSAKRVGAGSAIFFRLLPPARSKTGATGKILLIILGVAGPGWIALTGSMVAIGRRNDGRVVIMEFIDIDIGAAVLPSQESSNGRA
jgi:hypothetical protein